MSMDDTKKALTPEQIEKLQASRERAQRMRQPIVSQSERMEMLSELDAQLAEGRKKAAGKFYGRASRRPRHRRGKR